MLQPPIRQRNNKNQHQEAVRLIAEDSGTASVSGRETVLSSLPPANAVTLLTSQILEFGATEEQNVELWIARVDSNADSRSA